MLGPSRALPPIGSRDGVEVLVDLVCEPRTDARGRGELTRFRLADLGEGAEPLHQGSLPRRTDAGDLVERRRKRAAIAPLPVVRDREPVRFVADVLEHEE